MKLFIAKYFSFVYLLKFCFSYELIYEKNYGDTTDCLNDKLSEWKTIEGTTLTKCIENCTLENSSKYSKFISSTSPTKGLVFTYQASSIKDPFSVVGIDIIYFTTGGNSVKLTINDLSSLMFTSSPLSIYEENTKITCPDTRSYVKATVKAEISSLPSNKLIILKIESSSTNQHIGMRQIKIWSNCRQNCDICQDSFNCLQCMKGFKKMKMPSGEVVCEQTNSCTIANCQSCFKGTQIEICNSCYPGFAFDTKKVNCLPLKGPTCPASTYLDSASNCLAYSYQCQYFNKGSKQFENCYNQEDVYKYKCYPDKIVMIYENENYSIIQCGCSVENCKKCSTISSKPCEECSEGYRYDQQSQSCKSVCQPNYYYNNVSGGCQMCSISNCSSCPENNGCDQCSSGYKFKQNSNTCILVCKEGQYYDITSSSCLNCPDKNCLSCDDSTNKNECTLCKDDFSFSTTDKRCNKICKEGEYLDQESNNCLTCLDRNCLNCTNDKNCKSCKSGYQLNQVDESCFKNCKLGEYYDHQQDQCQQCQDKNCLNCISDHSCSQCKQGYEYSQNDQQCNLTCSNRQYYNKDQDACLDCLDKNCLQCQTNGLCSECQRGYQYITESHYCQKICEINEYHDDIKNDCYPCVDTNCENCKTKVECVNCKAGYHYSTKEERCQKNCKEFEYFDEQINNCYTCIDQNCLKCSSNNGICVECQKGYILSDENKTCSKSCESSEYFDKPSNSCIQCSSHCQTCNSGQCLKCKLDNFFIDPLIPKICSQCSNNCLLCSSSKKCEKCEEGFQLNELKSECFQINCQLKFCEKCDVKDTCKTCMLGYRLNSNKKCEQWRLEPTNFKIQSQEVGQDGYIITLSFNHEVDVTRVKAENFLVVEITNINPNQYSFKMLDVSSKSIKLMIYPTVNIKNQKVLFRIEDQLFLKENLVMERSIEEELKTFVIVEKNQIQISKQISSVGKGVSTAIITTMLPIVILSNFYILINTVDITGFLYYLLFIDIRHPYNVVSFYSIFKDFQFPFIPNFFESIVDSNYSQESPPKFMEKGTDRYFIKNTGQSITIWMIVISLYLIIKLLSKLKIKTVSTYLQKAIDDSWEYSAFFDLLWNTYIYPLVGVLLQLVCYDFSDPTYWINYTLHSIFTIITLCSPFIITYIIYKQEDIKNNTKFQKKFSTLIGGIQLYSENSTKKVNDEKQIEGEVNNDLKTSFERGKQQKIQMNNTHTNIRINQQPQSMKSLQFIGSEDNFNSQANIYLQSSSSFIIINTLTLKQKLTKYYNPLLYFRKLFFSLIIVYAYEYIEIQLILICLLNLVVITFLIVVRPLESTHENIKCIAGEIILILIQLCAFLLIEDSEDTDENRRLNIGWVIVGLSSFILLWHTLQLVYETLKSLSQTILKIVKSIFRKSSKIQSNIDSKKINIEVKDVQDNKDRNTNNQLQSNKQGKLQSKQTSVKFGNEIEINSYRSDTNINIPSQKQQNKLISDQEQNKRVRRKRDLSSTFSSARIISDIGTISTKRSNGTPQSIKNSLNQSTQNIYVPSKFSQNGQENSQRRKRRSLFSQNFASQFLIYQEDSKNKANIEYNQEEESFQNQNKND